MLPSSIHSPKRGTLEGVQGCEQQRSLARAAVRRLVTSPPLRTELPRGRVCCPPPTCRDCAKMGRSGCARQHGWLDLALWALNVNTEPGVHETEQNQWKRRSREPLGAGSFSQSQGGPSTSCYPSPSWCLVQWLLQDGIRAIRLLRARPVCPFPVPSEVVSLAALLTGGGDPGCWGRALIQVCKGGSDTWAKGVAQDPKCIIAGGGRGSAPRTATGLGGLHPAPH